MKKFTAFTAAVLALAVLTTATAMALGAGDAVYVNTRHVANNLSYTNTVSYINGTQRQESYALSLTGSGDAYPIVMACDTIYGSLTVDAMVSYAAKQGKNVLAAVNTDFFSMKTGVPMGIDIENGVYKSSPEGNTAVAFDADGSVRFSESPEVTMTLFNNGSASDASNSGQSVTLTHFNKYRADTGGLYLFSSAFSTVSTRTSTPGWFVKFHIESGSPSVSGTMSLVVTEVVQSDGAMPIGDGYLILSASDVCGYDSEFNKFKVGDAVTLTTTCTDPQLTNAKWATGGGDILVKDGAVTDQSAWDKAISAKNPRTAFGVKADGTVISYVIDGTENSAGLTLQALAEEMRARGCVDAVNFDGGGSSVLSVRLTGQSVATLVNKPSDGSERKCAAYLLFVTDKVPDGRAKNLGLVNDGVILLTGSSVTLQPAASDSGYKPVTTPSDMKMSGAALGAVTGMVYKAGAAAGTETLTLTSPSTGASGTGAVFIISKPTDISVTAQGKPVTALTLWPGDTVQLSSAASYYGRAVCADTAAFTYEAAGGVGSVSSGGLFTAGATAGVTGAVTVRVGGAMVSIPVTITGFTDTTTHWAGPYIKDLFQKGIVSGVTPTLFAPNDEISRGDFILMLYRAAGKPAVSGPSSFTDVAPDAYNAAAIAWAESVGIAKGDGSALFNPKGPLIREQAFSFLYRALSALKHSLPDAPASALAAYSDYQSVADYATVPTATLVSAGVISGAGGKLLPKANITRGEMAKILDVVIRLA
ncbi:phosphodiester glycosidase family protein [Oscillospiraceae bacterium CM]|nr:phosphodiester glycosidase family protein [Oscillospiraceae bacterium CM]